uniref:Cleavage and polyadenylation specificity factor subunit 3 n=1 Tax=Entomoneis paludosa TaxID=265537 RepID=A0A7S2Y2X5_9STRA|mmetsp:Transcript_1295/g.2844  ORF Transcript_1295/g.2844 Transcript_1295/m.2844 type:complete len:794 (+) Transcript_1295:238-2619(+)|eukprot:CAMPEP_0172453750 /NCGR_PEP_ID=MMETSP1065-20121228/10936_1 /TAXON_ID=265537 /ORGANISM="Amphiprora paludosa, Strain CCMP125" /LENGTH=793 /DNA_ID=CAMNT_0013205955 /DNA_START=242 /DNA_END=2623 /DNA_ORIENTATION=-
MAEDIMTITPLGSGQEVGRSCHVLEFRGLTILLDCGIHPGYDGLNGLPFLDRLEPDQIDVVLITHFHLDHAASLPYLTERTNFKGRIFMTHPTKAVLRLLLGDYLRLLSMKNAKPEDVLYTEADLNSCLNKVELIDYHTTVTMDGAGLSFYALNAGHVLGACMYFLEVGGRSILYTGDYSMEDDRHLMAAEIPHQKPDLLITESTYGVQVHASRAEREARFTGTVERVVTRGGRCLIPVFALGRAQELLLILDEYWQSHPHLQDIPIWYASKLASRALRVYQTYANMMNARIRAQMDVSNPFQFQYISNLKSIDVNSFDDSGPSVVFASPGMLQSGVSRQLFDRWASNPNNGVLIAGYAVEHTLAKEIMAQPKEVVTLEGRRQPLNCLVDYVSFSAHVDFVQNRSFIQKVAPKHIVLVHGQKDEMGRLKSALMLQYKAWPEAKRPTITMPPNLQEVKLRFARRRSAKVMGRLAEQQNEAATLTAGQGVQGILVTHQFHSKIVAPEDLATYTPLRVGTIASKLHVPFAGSLVTLQVFLTEMFAGITVETTSDATIFSLDQLVQVVVGHNKQTSQQVQPVANGTAIVEWDANPQGDVLADAVISLILHAQSSAASVRMTSQPCRHYRADDPENNNNNSESNKRAKTRTDTISSRLRFIYSTLKDQFETVEAVYEGNQGVYEIQTDCGFLPADASGTKEESDKKDILKCTVTVLFDDNDVTGDRAHVAVESRDEQLANHVRDCIQTLAQATQPIPLTAHTSNDLNTIKDSKLDLVMKSEPMETISSSVTIKSEHSE